MDDPDEARARAEAKFRKQEQQANESEKVWAERAAAEKAADANRARLKSLRLAMEAERVGSTKHGRHQKRDKLRAESKKAKGGG
jgi:hypothetical protein